MDNHHLECTIRWLERKAEEGVFMQVGGGSCADDMYYDEYMLFGQEALEQLNYADYVEEQLTRGRKKT